VTLCERGQWRLAAGYIALSLVLSMAGLFVGLMLIRLAGQGQAA
jgi:CrcB protein